MNESKDLHIYEQGKETKIFEKFLIILSPFAPHIAEELWEKLGHKKSIFLERWPEYDPNLIKDEEIEMVITGKFDPTDNPLKQSPHTAQSLLSSEWNHSYSREIAAYPVSRLKQNKYWPPVGRIDNVHGDRNLFCACVPVSEYEKV